MSIERVKKGSSPTLLDASKANEVINSINSIANMTVERGEEEKFVFGLESSTLVIKERTDGEENELSGILVDGVEVSTPTIDFQGTDTNDDSNVKLTLNSGDEISAITFKAISLNGLAGVDAELFSDDESITFEVKDNKIDLKGFTLNGLKGDANLVSDDYDTVGITVEEEANEIKLKGHSLNGMGAVDVTLGSLNGGVVVETDVDNNQIKIKGTTINGLGARNFSLIGLDDSISIDTVDIEGTDNKQLQFRGLRMNGFGATNASVVAEGNGIEVSEAIDPNRIKIKGTTLHGMGARNLTLVGEEGISVRIDSDSGIIYIGMLGQYKDLVICENGEQKTIKVRVFQ